MPGIIKQSEKIPAVGWKVVPPSSSTSKSLEPVNVTLFGNRVFADLTKLRILRWWDYSRSSEWP